MRGRSAGLAPSKGSAWLAPRYERSGLPHGGALPDRPLQSPQPGRARPGDECPHLIVTASSAQAAGGWLRWGGASAHVHRARRERRSLDTSPTRARAAQIRALPRCPAALPPLAGMLGGEDVRAGFMARSRSLSRFASRCTGTFPGTQPSLPSGILQLRASGIRGRPSPPRAGPQGERAGTDGPARCPAGRAAAAHWQGRGQLSHAGSRGAPAGNACTVARLATPSAWPCHGPALHCSYVE